MSFSENLQYLRKRDKITQEELADRLEVSRQSVSKWETGESFPETEKIIVLCDIFGVTMDELMRGDVTAAQPSDEVSGVRNGEVSFGGDVAAGAEQAEEAASRVADSRRTRLRAIGAAVDGIIMCGAIIAFFCLGAMLNLWHPAWLVFLLAISLCAFSENVFAKDAKEPYRPVGARIFSGLAGMTMLLSVTIYLFIGCVWGIWHPSWVIFIIAVVLMGGFDAIAKVICAGQSQN